MVVVVATVVVVVVVARVVGVVVGAAVPEHAATPRTRRTVAMERDRGMSIEVTTTVATEPQAGRAGADPIGAISSRGRLRRCR